MFSTAQVTGPHEPSTPEEPLFRLSSIASARRRDGETTITRRQLTNNVVADVDDGTTDDRRRQTTTSGTNAYDDKRDHIKRCPGNFAARSGAASAVPLLA
eukprot:8882070-Pyramimonas_sp.AAC.1